VTRPLPPDFAATLAACRAWLTACGTDGVVIGGLAASLLGRPRFTQDIDVLVRLAEPDWAQALERAHGLGLGPRVPDPLGFARRSRVLLLRHTATGIDLDVVIGGLPFEYEAIAAGADVLIGGAPVRLPRVEDMLVMKAIAHRPKDLADIEGLLAANPGLDLTRCRRIIFEFAGASAMPDIGADFERLATAAGHTRPTPE
jgi:hypothetical protein